jgi:hypothetical protein
MPMPFLFQFYSKSDRHNSIAHPHVATKKSSKKQDGTNKFLYKIQCSLAHLDKKCHHY